MKTKLFVFLFILGCIIPDILLAQFTQQGPKLIGSGDGGTQVYQGTSVAVSSDGNTIIEGGYGDNNDVGAVWVFTRSGGVWSQQGTKLVGTGGVVHPRQGTSVAISSDGNTAVVGGPFDIDNNNSEGAIWIFTRSGSVWTQQGSKLVGAGGIGNSLQGTSVAISSDGNTIIEGGYGDNNDIGAVWIFTRSNGVWTQQGSKLVGAGEVGNSRQGISVAISSDGNTAIEGGYFDNDTTGAVWVFTRSAGVWSQQGTKFVGSGTVGKAWQGFSVTISADGNTAIEGGYFDNSNSTFSGIGAAWVFTRSGNVWTQQGPKLIGSGAIGNADQGYSVSISADGNTAIVGGYRNNNYAGAVWVFNRSGGVWTQQNTYLYGADAVGNSGQGFSSAISSDGSTVVVGGPGNTHLGAAWIFFNPMLGITPISGEVPNNFSLLQNYPNPFNPSTKIRFGLPNPSEGGAISVHLTIYDVLGREVSTIVNQQLQPGTYEVNFDATNFESGVYFYKLQTESFSETKKMILIK